MINYAYWQSPLSPTDRRANLILMERRLPPFYVRLLSVSLPVLLAFVSLSTLYVFSVYSSLLLSFSLSLCLTLVCFSLFPSFSLSPCLSLCFPLFLSLFSLSFSLVISLSLSYSFVCLTYFMCPSVSFLSLSLSLSLIFDRSRCLLARKKWRNRM